MTANSTLSRKEMILDEEVVQGTLLLPTEQGDTSWVGTQDFNAAGTARQSHLPLDAPPSASGMAEHTGSRLGQAAGGP